MRMLRSETRLYTTAEFVEDRLKCVWQTGDGYEHPFTKILVGVLGSG